MKNYYFVLLLLLLSFSCKKTTRENLIPKEKNVVENITTNVIVDQTSDQTEDIIEVIEPIEITEPQKDTKEDISVDSRLIFEIEKITDKEILLKHMKNLFETIEEKIAERNYNGWYNSLSDNYKSYIDNKSELEKMSNKSPYLQNKGIILKNSEEFFNYVVIEAREGYKLKFKDYERIDNENVNVYSYIEGFDFNYKYKFIYEKGSWKLDR